MITTYRSLTRGLPWRVLGNCLLLASVLISGCTGTPVKSQPTDAAPATQQSALSFTPTSTPVTPTSTPEPTLEPTPTLTPETTQTPTLIPTAPEATAMPTEVLTPTLGGPVVMREIYGVGGCQFFTIWGNIKGNFCVVNMEIRQDGTMKVTVSWTAYLNGWTRGLTKFSDVGNPDMYISDNLGNKYAPIAWGSEATQNTRMADGQAYFGWFFYPPAKEGATTFTYHEADNGLLIEDMYLNKPMTVFEALALRGQDLALEYQNDLWDWARAEDGSLLLTNRVMPLCQILERSTNELKGKYKNTMPLDQITYEIYGWLEEKVGVREYRVAGGLEMTDPENPPVFQVTIPLDESQRCLNESGTVLASLQPTLEKTP